MTDYDLSISLNNFNPATQTSFTTQKRLSSTNTADPAADRQFESVHVTKSHYDFKKLEDANTTLHVAAKNIRMADRTIDIIEKQVNRMRDQLKTQIKNFPPFPAGSEERVKFLKGFNAFRKQIDSMTFPPDHDYATKIMADPAVVPGAGDWEIIVGESGHHKIIHSKEIHTGPTGLDIPELPEDSDVNMIKDAVAKINKHAKVVLKQAKTGLTRDIVELAEFRNQITRIDGFSESVAEPKSKDMRHILSGNPEMRLTQAPFRWFDQLDN